MSRPKEPTGPVQRVLDLLHKVEVSGAGWTALCPAHHDRAKSLCLIQGDEGRILLKCHAGCDTREITDAIGLKLRDLFPGSAKPKTSRGGVTLRAYAKMKGLPKKFLRKLGVDQIYLQSEPVVRMPYMDADGATLCTRMRVSMDGEPRFRWKTGSKPVLYGLWRLATKKFDYVCLVEGESDAQTLWLNHFSALGLPGAATWNESWAEHFDRFARIYVVIEPDKGGETVLKWLARSRIRDRARLLTIEGAKDPSELYLSDPERFRRAWKGAMKSAVPWSEAEAADKKSKRRAAWKKCKRIARGEDVLSDFIEALEQCGVVGETRAAKLLYLALTSRVLKKPVSAVVTGPSSAGKSFLVERTLDFFPSTSYYDLTAMSERALIYSTEPLSHRFLVLYEGAAL